MSTFEETVREMFWGQGAHPCGCMGPQNGEPVCPCAMKYVKVVDGHYIQITDLGKVGDPAFGGGVSYCIDKIRAELKENFANVSLSNRQGRRYKVTVENPIFPSKCNSKFVTEVLAKYDLDIKNVTVDTDTKVVVMCKPGEPDLQTVSDEILAFWANYAIGGTA